MTKGQAQNEGHRPHTRGKMREKTAGNTSAFVKVRRNLLKSIKYSQNVCNFFCVLTGKLLFTN